MLRPSAQGQGFGVVAGMTGTSPLAAGAVGYKVYDRRVAEGKTDPNVVRIIWKTPEYADYNFTAHPLLTVRYGEDFMERLQKALMNRGVLLNPLQKRVHIHS